MIDSHAHLDLCEPPNGELIANALKAGVTRILNIGLDADSSRAALLTAEEFPEVFAGVGRHPTTARGFGSADAAELEELAAHERCVAIGESGIDLHRDPAPLADQQAAFAAQIELAGRMGKPLVIHTRDADSYTMDQLALEAGSVCVLMHCFSMTARLQECLERGYMISFAGNVTYKSAAELADAARAVPAERLLVETDSPYLTPQAVRKHRNEPAFVTHTLDFLAQLRGLGRGELAAIVEGNAARLFKW